MRKVLIANRGEIAVRVARACRDAGLISVAVYADPDRSAMHVQLTDEAYALDGSAPADTYLNIDKLIDIARRAGADAVHPGYGFLSESGAFATAVIAAGLTWIGPPPAAIEALGDKVRARAIARDVGAPLAAGTKDPVADVGEVLAFADEHGLPIAIKAAFGGGGRGLKVVWKREDVEALYDSAVREAVAAFGRGECFVERYLDRPRHVETQILADQHGTVVVAGTRDCSLQRRHQKVVEEAPAPFLDDEQLRQIHQASKAIISAAGYVGAGTCEFLVGQDHTVSFLEVNTRLQVEHPVTEETSGVDLVRAQFAIADGQRLRDSAPAPRGHAFEFRINAEDPARDFLPTPGLITTWRLPSGPGVRVDAGYAAGDTVPGNYDSLLAKLIVTGSSRSEALRRAARALDEFEVGGVPTILPFHRAVVRDPAFARLDSPEPFAVHTRWIETEFMPEFRPPAQATEPPPDAPERQTITVEVGGRRFDVSLPVTAASGSRQSKRKPPGRRTGAVAAATSGDSLTSPMQGTIVKVSVEEGQRVDAGDPVVVLEAMKMEQPIAAHKAGTIRAMQASVGAVVEAGAVLCEIDSDDS